MTEHKPWLSLPDEDPPERGFAELMAAARVKAEVMANPPWWKRLFAVARRPPVLALATVVVVLCGVIVVGRPHDQATSPPPPPSEQQAPVENKAELKHEAPQVVAPVDGVKAQTETLDQVETVKAPEMPKGGLKKPAVDPLARCRAAAARRDCTAAKACVKQAGRVDVGDDAALKSCL